MLRVLLQLRSKIVVVVSMKTKLFAKLQLVQDQISKANA